jgi:hypothetical protein
LSPTTEKTFYYHSPATVYFVTVGLFCRYNALFQVENLCIYYEQENFFSLLDSGTRATQANQTEKCLA